MATTEELARKHGLSVGAVEALQDALRSGGGAQAQFNHRELGGMGQWSVGGMTQIGDMFNTALKDKVGAVCSELAKRTAHEPSATAHSASPAGNWWPERLGRPSSSGAQNGMRYAYFPDSQRVAVEQAGKVTLYDSGDHRITGVSQQQSGSQDLTFSSQKGTVRATDLPVAS